MNQLKIEINNLHNLLNNVNNGNTTIPYSKIELLNNIRDSEHLLLEKQKQLKNLKSYIDILKIKYLKLLSLLFIPSLLVLSSLVSFFQ